ncbi:hypothetical protein EI171_39840 [Bradyrhizobium sp. LCT2]|uniref:hypothetical protein n=1 Tax=Bradyrhizobium sp. LCT2 TaxID=2493093 RepID=UPI001374415F|nr:hypothetical protein [Bradyrhizobium sp. LCT2]QHP72939.1 hypothetical protein EI171_39840 [Bradyrhizobium sp. LCT2]
MLDQAEISDDGSVVLMFGTVAGDWLQAQLTSAVTVPLDPAGSTQFYASMPLYLLEVRYDPVDVIAIGGPTSFGSSIEAALLALEGIWVRIALAYGGRPAALFDNLFGPAIDVGVVSIEPAAPDAGQFLNSLDPLDPVTGVPDATEQEIENALRSSSTLDEIAVYDVGQGSANGLISNQEVVCYFDFGAAPLPTPSRSPQRLPRSASAIPRRLSYRIGITITGLRRAAIPASIRRHGLCRDRLRTAPNVRLITLHSSRQSKPQAAPFWFGRPD